MQIDAIDITLGCMFFNAAASVFVLYAVADNRRKFNDLVQTVRGLTAQQMQMRAAQQQQVPQAEPGVDPDALTREQIDELIRNREKEWKHMLIQAPVERKVYQVRIEPAASNMPPAEPFLALWSNPQPDAALVWLDAVKRTPLEQQPDMWREVSQ